MCNKYIYLLCGFQSTNSDRFSGDSYEGPPVPISNTVVKLVNAESTWLETAWEDRKSLIKLKANRMVSLFLLYILICRIRAGYLGKVGGGVIEGNINVWVPYITLNHAQKITHFTIYLNFIHS